MICVSGYRKYQRLRNFIPLRLSEENGEPGVLCLPSPTVWDHNTKPGLELEHHIPGFLPSVGSHKEPLGVIALGAMTLGPVERLGF